MPDTQTRIITVTPVVTAGAYSANDALGGLLVFKDALLPGLVQTGVILTVTLLDAASQDAATDLVLFNQTFTATADNAAFAPSDADLLNCLGVISIAAGDYATFSGNSIATVRNAGFGAKSVDTIGAQTGTSTGDGNLYGQLVTRATPTYAATSDISVTITVLQD